MILSDKIDDYLDGQTKAQLDKARRIIASAKRPLTVNLSDDDDFGIKVPSESMNDGYFVDIHNDDDFNELMFRCECPAFEEYDDCKHCVAAAITLQDHIAENEHPEIIELSPQQQLFAPADYDGYIQFKMDDIDTYMLQRLAGNIGNNIIAKIANTIKSGPIGMPHQYFSYYEKSKKYAT